MRELFWDVQILARTRRWSDGMTFFRASINYDRYDGDHKPSLEFEITILNIYNHIWIYKGCGDTFMKRNV